MTPDGRFDVVWEEAFSSTDHDIKLNRYNPSGVLQGTSAISLSTAFDETPAVAMDSSGNAVVAWERAGDIKARRVSATGSLGSEINIANSSNFEFGPTVAIRKRGGSFVVSYESLTPITARAKVAEVSTSGTVTTFDAGDRSGGSVSIDSFDHYLLTYTSPDLEIHGRHGFLP
jgi:hypothetical protein